MTHSDQPTLGTKAPPRNEKSTKFFAYTQERLRYWTEFARTLDQGQFVNGVRLVYPMEDRAMRFFNHVGKVLQPRHHLVVKPAH